MRNTKFRSGIATLEGMIAEVCVVGSGPVGLAVASDLARRGHSVILLESGAEKPNSSSAALSEAQIATPERHAPTRLTLCRAFGGNSWLWGGRCVPLDPVDFVKRAFEPDRNWPISYKEIADHYRAAAEFLDCGASQFELLSTQLDELGLSGNGGIELDHVERWCAEPIIPLRKTIADLPRNLQVVTNVTVVDLDCADGEVKAITVAEHGRTRLFAGAQLFVLACGGLETARLLLIAQRRQPGLFGGPEGSLGRFYMGHLSGHPTNICFGDPAFSKHFRYRDDGSSVSRARITLSKEMQEVHRLPNVAFWPANPAISDPAHGNGLLSMLFLALSVPAIGNRFVSEAIRQMQMTETPHYLAHTKNVILDLPQAMGQTYDLLVQKFAKKRRKPFFFRNCPGCFPAS